MNRRPNFLIVIAIDEYKSPDWPNLNNAVKDAKEVISILTERYKFELLDEPLFNDRATRANISQLFANALNQLMAGDNVVVYFAGHGFMNPQTHKGFWVPYEANITPTEMISNSEIKDFIEVLPAQHVLLIADSCFSGTFITRNRGRYDNASYEELDGKKSRWVLTSGHEEKVSDGAEGANSPFARYLKRFLSENTNAYASVAELIKYVCAMTSSVSRQKPQGASISNVGHADGQFVFILKNEYIVTKVGSTDNNPATIILRRELRSVYKQKSKYSGGKEIMLMNLTRDPKVLILAENFRFDDDGNNKLSFSEGMVIMKSKDGSEKYPVYARAATWEGMNRFMEENIARFKEVKIVIWNAHKSIEEVESTEAAITQQEFIQDLIDQNQDQMRCLHCGKMISTNDSYTVEIDEIGLRANAGNVHRECLRPVDRIIGKMMFPEITDTKLVNFDYHKWLELRQTGQGFLAGAMQIAKDQPGAIISWNKTHQHLAGDFCIKFTLSDNTQDYLKIGKDIHRFTGAEIDQEVEQMNKQRGIFGMLSLSKTFGNVEYLEGVKMPDEQVLPIIHYAKVRYSNQLEAAESELISDYAPLGILQTTEGKIITFDDFIPLITDPTVFDELYENWSACNLIDEPCTIKILENDKDIDFYLIGFFDDGLTPVLNPLFDENRQLLGGVRIADIRRLIIDGKQSQSDLSI